MELAKRSRSTFIVFGEAARAVLIAAVMFVIMMPSSQVGAQSQHAGDRPDPRHADQDRQRQSGRSNYDEELRQNREQDAITDSFGLCHYVLHYYCDDRAAQSTIDSVRCHDIDPRSMCSRSDVWCFAATKHCEEAYGEIEPPRDPYSHDNRSDHSRSRGTQ